MKRKERHHLKENEIQIFARQARETLETRQREAAGLVLALLAIAVVVAAYFGWRAHVEGKAHALLADAIAVQDARVVPPPAPGTAPPAPVAGTYPTEHARAQAAL